MERIAAIEQQIAGIVGQLESAGARAEELQASCPTQIAEGAVARLDAMSDRLHAMVQAIETLRPALTGFYASLGDEQKAKFNSLGQQNAEMLTGRQH